jgi:N-acetylneuraminic acid mutarotase
MNKARFGHTASVLQDGQVLVIGGAISDHDIQAVNSTELYDPLTGTWTVTGSINNARYWHTSSVLPTGKVLVTGGDNGANPQRSTELYDPLKRIWTNTGSMSDARYDHTATVLTNGKVLVTGGGYYVNGVRYSTELFDPSRGYWTKIGNMCDARAAHTASVLTNGKVLLTGGENDNGWPLDSAELY